ncbi:MAG: LamG domain-containing protein, partial [Phycisphaerales bacterium]
VWSFTVEPFAYPIVNVEASSNGISDEGTGPENTVNGSGLNPSDQHSIASEDMWLTRPADGDPIQIEYAFDRVYKLHEMLVWNYNVQFELLLGFGIRNVTVEYSEDGSSWVALGDFELAQATARADYSANTTIPFGGVPVRHVRLSVNSGYGLMGQFGLSEVRFLYIPVQAREPEPTDGAANIGVDADISWRTGREAVAHEVYLSTDEAAVVDGSALIDVTDGTAVDPGPLDLAATYYWRITEVNEAEPISTWEGAIWSFSTQDYLVVDDFEVYDDEDNRIYDTWLDGWVNDTGSTVGYLEAPFAETTTVHGGSQAMPLFYDNTGVATSEAEFELSQEWTASGIRSLSLYFQGAADNSGQLYLKINGTKVMYDGEATDLKRALWQPWNVDLVTLGGDLGDVTKLTIGIEGAGATGVVYIDDIRLYPKTVEFIAPVEPDNANLLVHYAFDGNVADSSGNGVAGEENGAPIYGDGVDGQAMQFDGTDDYVNAVLDVPENGGTTAFWFKTTNPNCGLYAVVQNPLGDGGYDRMIYLINGNVGVRIWDTEVIIAAVNVADGRWHHLVHTYGDAIGGQRLYLDGLLQAWGTKAESDFDWQERVHFGWSVDAAEAYFEGMLDDARVYDRTLSLAEIAWLAGRTAPIAKPFEDDDL